ncbi:hypothetical protein CSC2_40990 [Clostridium zeae]|uniref:Molybdopterin-guanine dinucleotide biosynthesis protein B n=1 Tax=Clostridium zeae TaxID=2759022 RepID=A0ABQ1EG96_9CLOT|nr:hypothetical protein [Clostridium zeae]GFZ33573.1 hypothetical protein CSC2_40990 [Clostridium zeae]
MKKELMSIEHMILIGSTGRNSGKTTLAASLIRKWKGELSVIALKVTTIEHKNGKCPRGGEGCGICTNIEDNFELVEEINPNKNKDTSLLLSAGADRVYWLKCLNDHLEEGIECFMSKISKNTLIICESNSLRNVVLPGSFVMIKNICNDSIKKSAAEVMNKADFILENDFTNKIDDFINKIIIEKDSEGIRVKK